MKQPRFPQPFRTLWEATIRELQQVDFQSQQTRAPYQILLNLAMIRVCRIRQRWLRHDGPLKVALDARDSCRRIYHALEPDIHLLQGGQRRNGGNTGNQERILGL